MALFDCVELYSSTQSVAPIVIVVYTIDADGVQYAVVLDEVGAVAFVTVTPPAEYPAPFDSPVAVYAVVLAFIVAVARYNAALIVSAVVPALTTLVPSAWCPFKSSTLKLVHIACVLATLTSIQKLLVEFQKLMIS
mgnify:CR=1 FL=1